MANLSQLAPVKLTSGTNLKTINGESLLGSGNIVVSGGGGGGTPALAETAYALTPEPFATVTAASAGNITQTFQHTDSSWGMLQVASYYNPPQVQFKYGQAGVTPDLATYFPVGSVWQNAGGMAQVVSVYNPASGQTNRYVAFQAVNGDTNSLNGFLDQQYWPNNQSPPWTLTFIGTTITTNVALTNGVVYTLANGASAFTGNGGTSYTLPGSVANGAKIYKRDNPIFDGGVDVYNNATNALILPANGEFSGSVRAAGNLIAGASGGADGEKSLRLQLSDKRRCVKVPLIGSSSNGSSVILTTDNSGAWSPTNGMPVSNTANTYAACYIQGFAFSYYAGQVYMSPYYAHEVWAFSGVWRHSSGSWQTATVTKTRQADNYQYAAVLELGSYNYQSPVLLFTGPQGQNMNDLVCIADVNMICFEP